jgi:stalled ribosome alternative rescue factor ArfA
MNEHTHFPKANYEFHLRKDVWTFRAAICLLFGREPLAIGYKHFFKDGNPIGEGEFILYRDLINTFIPEMTDAYKLLITSKKSGKIKVENNRIKPIRFIRWAKRNKYYLPKEFNDFLKQQKTTKKKKKKSIKHDRRQDLIESCLLKLRSERKKGSYNRKDVTAREIFEEIRKSYNYIGGDNFPISIIDEITDNDEIVFCKQDGDNYKRITYKSFENRVTKAKKNHPLK